MNDNNILPELTGRQNGKNEAWLHGQGRGSYHRTPQELHVAARSTVSTSYSPAEAGQHVKAYKKAYLGAVREHPSGVEHMSRLTMPGKKDAAGRVAMFEQVGHRHGYQAARSGVSGTGAEVASQHLATHNQQEPPHFRTSSNEEHHAYTSSFAKGFATGQVDHTHMNKSEYSDGITREESYERGAEAGRKFGSTMHRNGSLHMAVNPVNNARGSAIRTETSKRHGGTQNLPDIRAFHHNGFIDGAHEVVSQHKPGLLHGVVAQHVESVGKMSKSATVDYTPMIQYVADRLSNR